MSNYQSKAIYRLLSLQMNYPLTIILKMHSMFFEHYVNYPIEIWKTKALLIQSKFHYFICIFSISSNRLNLDLKSRIFSLRLIMQILQTSGPVFRSSEDFLQIIKTNLCVSLSRNGVSSIPELFEMALFNFVELLDKFKAHLKIQIEVSWRPREGAEENLNECLGSFPRNLFNHSRNTDEFIST